MNEHDRNNLNFLLTIDDSGLKAWFEQADQDDLKYAFELIEEYRDKITTLEIESELRYSDFDDATKLLEKFKL